MTRGEFSPATKQLIRERDHNRCVLCGVWVGDGGQIHHRRARGMGGSRDPLTASPANGLTLCAGPYNGNQCHEHIESHRRWALDHGFLVRQGTDPASVAVVVDVAVAWWLLHDGTRRKARADERTN